MEDHKDIKTARFIGKPAAVNEALYLLHIFY
jgi:hypothetical protein